MSKTVELLQPIQKLLKGIDIAADAIGGTMGPRGRNAFIDDPAFPRVTNDGKTIADSIILADPFENAGAWFVKNTAAQTADDAGDGTSTSSVLFQAIVHEALKRPENAMEVSLSLKDTLPKVIKAIKDKSQKVKSLKEVALISSEHEELAERIAELVEKVGPKGTVMLEESSDGKTSHEFIEGYEANVGYLSPYFVTDQKHMRAEYTEVGVFVTEKKISGIGDVQRLFEQLKEKKIRQLCIVCEDIDMQMLGIFVTNKLQGLLNIVVIKATGPLLQDIAAAVGATPISDSTGVTFDNLDVSEHLGQAHKVVATEKKTVFVSDAPSAKQKARELEAFAQQNPNQFEARKARERSQKLKGGVAILRVGSPTTVDMGYLKDKAEDAILATQAALEEGVVEGGGMTLWRIAHELKGKTIGEQILSRALKSPLLKIIENTGKEVVMGADFHQPNTGYDAKNHKFVDLIASGIIDPAKVERVAVTNALLNAAQFITIHAAIINNPEEKK